MSPRSRYRTKHHDTVLAFLQERAGSCFTVDDICTALNESGDKIERTTVYRQLEKIAEDGAAVKYISEKGNSASYSIAEDGTSPHLHLKCLDCGGLTHLDCPAADVFTRHLLEEHSFAISRANTVIYGHCGCAERGLKKDHDS